MFYVLHTNVAVFAILYTVSRRCVSLRSLSTSHLFPTGTLLPKYLSIRVVCTSSSIQFQNTINPSSDSFLKPDQRRNYYSLPRCTTNDQNQLTPYDSKLIHVYIIYRFYVQQVCFQFPTDHQTVPANVKF